MTGSDWTASSRKRAEVAAIAALGFPILKGLGSTWTWKVSGGEQFDAVLASGHQPIVSFWHGRILPATIYFQQRAMVGVVSESYDGEWIARILHRFGYGTSRGSSSRGGSNALRQLLRDVKAKSVAFTLDGPRGPAQVAHPGAVWLAKATGNPLLPFHAEAVSSWTIKSWDRTMIPKPMTTVVAAIGEPLYVPRDADDAALEEWRLRLEHELAECKKECVTRS